MSRPKAWLQMVRAAKSEALLAVKLYNEPNLERSLEAFGVHMHLAWLYLLQAEFLRDGVDYRYPHPSIRGRYKKIDGEYATWDLERCTLERWPDENDPVRANLKFFIKFRNKTEHRYRGRDAQLFAAISDKSQALLLNFEQELTSQFGADHSLADQLKFPVFIGTFTEPAEAAIVRLNQSLPPDLKKFIAEYDSGLSDEIVKDSRYSFRLKVRLTPAQRGVPDLAIKFVRADELSPDETKKLNDVGQTGSGTVIVKERAIPTSNMGLFKHNAVVSLVSALVPFEFNTSHLQSAIRKENIKPPLGDKNPERTRTEFCIYDSLNKNYGYTQAYIDHLVAKLQTDKGFQEVTGRDPKRIQVESNQ